MTVCRLSARPVVVRPRRSGALGSLLGSLLESFLESWPPSDLKPTRHGRCRPERDDEAKIDRVPYQAVEQRRADSRRLHRPAGEIVGHLVQVEQLEGVDQKPHTWT